MSHIAILCVDLEKARSLSAKPPPGSVDQVTSFVDHIGRASLFDPEHQVGGASLVNPDAAFSPRNSARSVEDVRITKKKRREKRQNMSLRKTPLKQAPKYPFTKSTKQSTKKHQKHSSRDSLYKDRNKGKTADDAIPLEWGDDSPLPGNDDDDNNDDNDDDARSAFTSPSKNQFYPQDVTPEKRVKGQPKLTPEQQARVQRNRYEALRRRREIERARVGNVMSEMRTDQNAFIDHILAQLSASNNPPQVLQFARDTDRMEGFKALIQSRYPAFRPDEIEGDRHFIMYQFLMDIIKKRVDETMQNNPSTSFFLTGNYSASINFQGELHCGSGGSSPVILQGQANGVMDFEGCGHFDYLPPTIRTNATDNANDEEYERDEEE